MLALVAVEWGAAMALGHTIEVSRTHESWTLHPVIDVTLPRNSIFPSVR
jgi:hypothetical protein